MRNQFFKLFIPGLLMAAFILSCTPGAETPVDNTAEIQALIDKNLEIWNNGNMDLVAELYADNFVREAPNGTQRGLDEFKAVVEGNRASFPDFRVEITDLMVKGDEFYVQWKTTGTNTGPLGENIPATGKTINNTGFSKVTLQEGKIVKEVVMWDQLGSNMQLGFTLVPPQIEAETPEE